MSLSFADELKQRIAPRQILFFLRVEKRGLEFPLTGFSIDYRRIFMVPGMILAVIEKKDDYLVVEWNGPALQVEYKGHKTISPYEEHVSFTMDVAVSFLADGSVIQVASDEVVKMENHVPAVLY
ncbi:MAG: hypothetical protein Q7K65_03855 [Candidatus Buchananbacteria bacterium]|nr:hypothetical protein [Candidatus Buchananbacteria bacterium]